MINAEFNESINDLTTENLYQWDSYQTLRITGIDFGSVSPKVHFANKKSVEALAVQGVLKNDGSCEVSIPNTLLGEKYDIVAYIYTNTGLTYKTIKSITIPIVPRLKPTNYTQPTNEEIAEIEEIEIQAKGIIDGLTASEYDENESYKRPNIVYYNQNAYMCKASNEVTGILPTDTTIWQEIVHGEHIANVGVDNEGKLTFTTSSGTTFSIDFQTKDGNLVDDADIPALNLTAHDVEKLNNIGKELAGSIKMAVTGSSWYAEFSISKTGLYAVCVRKVVDGITYEGVSSLINIDDLTKDETVRNVQNNLSYRTYDHTLTVMDIPTATSIVKVRLVVPYEV